MHGTAPTKHSKANDRRPLSLTRKDVAALLSISIRRVRDLEGKSIPYRTDGKGVHRFKRADVEAYAITRGVAPMRAAHDDDSEQAAQVFELLEKGTGRVEIVTQLRIHPDVVNVLANTYEKMKATPSGVALCARSCGAPARFCGECNRRG